MPSNVDGETAANERIQREKDAHNRFFSEDTRRTARKYYSIDEASRQFYRDGITSGCSGKHVLEYGCGPGSHAFFLARSGAVVDGVDISEVAIEQATTRAREELLRHTSFRVMNAEALEYPDDSFDIICGTSILHHLDLPKAYGEIARTLKADGRAVFLEPLGHNPLINLYRKLTPGLRTHDEHPLMMQDLWLARQYFDAVDVTHFNLLSLSAVPFRRMPGFARLTKFLHKADKLAFRSLPLLKRWSWICVLALSRPRKSLAT